MNIEDTIKNLKLFLFDMDGTLYLGNRLFHFTKELLSEIKRSGGRYMFMTNNSSKSVKDYIIKLHKLGIEADYSDFVTSSQATCHYLKKHHTNDRIYVCGTESLKNEFKHNGLIITENPQETDCIVLGFDTELTFKKLHDISLLLCTKQLPYIATNPDYVCPTEFGAVHDCGSIADILYNAMGKRPLFIGKPQPFMAELAMKMTSAQRCETAVIGDRIYTDIKSGINAGIVSMLVMSGETTEEILNASADKPDIVLENAGEILGILKQQRPRC